MNTKTYLQLLSFVLISSAMISGAILFDGALKRQSIRKNLQTPLELPTPKDEDLKLDSLLGSAVWPKVFEDKKFQYQDGQEKQAIVDGMMFWANIFTGEKLPDGARSGLKKIGNFLNIDPTPENLIKLSKELEQKEKDLVI